MSMSNSYSKQETYYNLQDRVLKIFSYLNILYKYLLILIFWKS